MSQWNKRTDQYRESDRDPRQRRDEDRPRRRASRDNLRDDFDQEFDNLDSPYESRDSGRRALPDEWQDRDDDYRDLPDYPRDRLSSRGRLQSQRSRMDSDWDDRRSDEQNFAGRQHYRRSEELSPRRFEEPGSPYASQQLYTGARQPQGREPGNQPWHVPGPHTGRGPAGFRRSAERIKEDVCERLERHGYVDATKISVEVDAECNVTLSGTVPTKEQKRMAEDAAESVHGLKDVHNRLSVQRDDDDLQRHTSGSTRKGPGAGQSKSGESNKQHDV